MCTDLIPMAASVSVSINSHLLIAICSLFAGIAIFVKPRLLSYIVGGYLIVVGALGLLSHI